MKNIGWLIVSLAALGIYISVRNAANSVTGSISSAAGSISSAAGDSANAVASVAGQSMQSIQDTQQAVSNYLHKWDSGANITAADTGGINVAPITPTPDAPDSELFAGGL